MIDIKVEIKINPDKVKIFGSPNLAKSEEEILMKKKEIIKLLKSKK